MGAKKLAFSLYLVLMSGCSMGIRLADDPHAELLPHDIHNAVRRNFTPEVVPVIRDVHFSVEEDVSFLWFEAAGTYNPLLEMISLSRDGVMSGTGASREALVVHEVLHHIWSSGMVPRQRLFKKSLDRFLDDSRFEKFAAVLRKDWQKRREQGQPFFLRLNEQYSTIGETLVNTFADVESGLPPYMRRHYKGILNGGLLVDRRQCKGQPCLVWRSVKIVITVNGKQKKMFPSWRDLWVLLHYGAYITEWSRMDVLRPTVRPEASSSSVWLPKGTKPDGRVRLLITGVPADSTIDVVRCESGREHTIATVGVIGEDGVCKVWFSWSELLKIRRAYEDGTLRIRQV